MLLKRIKRLAQKLVNPIEEQKTTTFSPIEIFFQNGCKPWTEGYREYKWDSIQKAINGNFSALIKEEKYGYRIDERIVELPWALSRIPSENGRLLDAGSALNFPTILYHPKLMNKHMYIATLAYEGYACPERGISYIYEDIRQTSLRENFFDTITCISTIEHVGMDNTLLYNPKGEAENTPESYLEFLNVLHSLLKPGGRLLLSFPYGKPVNRGWFQVFDGDMLSSMIEQFQPAACDETIFKYENDGWHISTREAAADSTCFDIHQQKEYEPDYLAFARSVVCLDMVKR